MSLQKVHIVGGGLAGAEAAWQLTRRGVPVVLHEMKPARRSEAHHQDGFAELVCSNSFRSDEITHAAGLLKHELRRLGSLIMEAAQEARVPAGSAMAVDREQFSALVTARLRAQPLLEIQHGELDHIPAEGIWIFATGPLTSPGLSQAIASLCGAEQLYFYDAIAPILDADTVNMDVCWAQSRYDKGDGDDYINCPMDEAQYKAFIQAILAAPLAPARDFEETRFFEGCLPIETMASRGEDVLRFGPMKPVGLVDPRTGEQPYAVVQLRYENVEGTAYNMVGFQSRMKWGAQQEIFRTIPGLEGASFLRFGTVHRNTFLNGPALLDDRMRLRKEPRLRFAGQITGVEGYIESTAVGLLAALALSAELHGDEGYVRPPDETALGALSRYVCGELVEAKRYQPSNINWSLFPRVKVGRRAARQDKKLIKSQRALEAFDAWVASQPTAAQSARAVEPPPPPPNWEEA
jgi:methylenetetrahydrofolate--tRNA-(uracil-5-)-methyltransferase